MQAYLFNEMTLMREIDRLHKQEVDPLLENRKLNWKAKMHIMGKYANLRCDAVSYRKGEIKASVIAEELDDLRQYIDKLKVN
jgi:hypothetical protein